MPEKTKSRQKLNLRDYVNGYGQWFYLKAKIGWASWLVRQSSGLSKAKLKAMLVLILLTWVAYCSFLVIRGFSGQQSTGVYLTPIQRIIPANRGSNTGMKISEGEYERIRKFHNYMDSLKGNIADKSVYDSLLRARPGLMDSIRLMENYYESNVKR